MITSVMKGDFIELMAETVAAKQVILNFILKRFYSLCLYSINIYAFISCLDFEEIC